MGKLKWSPHQAVCPRRDGSLSRSDVGTIEASDLYVARSHNSVQTGRRVIQITIRSIGAGFSPGRVIHGNDDCAQIFCAPPAPAPTLMVMRCTSVRPCGYLTSMTATSVPTKSGLD